MTISILIVHIIYYTADFTKHAFVSFKSELFNLNRTSEQFEQSFLVFIGVLFEQHVVQDRIVV